jgi:hypothetical protein
VAGRRGKRRQHLSDDLKEKRGYCELNEEALDRILWRTHFGFDDGSEEKSFGSGYGPVVRQTTE